MEMISQRSLTLGLRLGAVWYEGKFGGLGCEEERWECVLFLSLPISQGGAFWRNLRGGVDRIPRWKRTLKAVVSYGPSRHKIERSKPYSSERKRAWPKHIKIGVVAHRDISIFHSGLIGGGSSSDESGAVVFDVVEPDEIPFLTRCQRRARSGTMS